MWISWYSAEDIGRARKSKQINCWVVDNYNWSIPTKNLQSETGTRSWTNVFRKHAPRDPFKGWSSRYFVRRSYDLRFWDLFSGQFVHLRSLLDLLGHNTNFLWYISKRGNSSFDQGSAWFVAEKNTICSDLLLLLIMFCRSRRMSEQSSWFQGGWAEAGIHVGVSDYIDCLTC